MMQRYRVRVNQGTHVPLRYDDASEPDTGEVDVSVVAVRDRICIVSDSRITIRFMQESPEDAPAALRVWTATWRTLRDR